MNQAQSQTPNSDQPPSQVIQAQFEISGPPKTDNHQLQLQQQQANYQKALMLPQVNHVQMPMPMSPSTSTDSALKPYTICVYVVHILAMLASGIISYNIYNSEVYPLLDSHDSIFYDYFKDNQDCLNFLDALYYLAPISKVIAVWSLISLLAILSNGVGGCWCFFHIGFLIFNLVQASEGSNSTCKQLYFEVTALDREPPYPADYYFILCAGSVLMFVSGAAYNYFKKKYGPTLPQTNQTPQPQGNSQNPSQQAKLMVQPYIGLYPVPTQTTWNFQQQNYPQTPIRYRECCVKPEHCCAGVLHFIVIAITASIAYELHNSDTYFILNLIYNHQKTKVDEFLAQYVSCYTYLEDIYLIVPISVCYIIWMIGSFIIVVKECIGWLWGLCQVGFLILSAFYHYEMQDSSCPDNLHKVQLDFFISPILGNYYYLMLWETGIMTVAGLMWRACAVAEAEGKKIAEERRKLQAGLLSVNQ